MKKIYNPTDIQQKEGQELSKKLYRTITEQAKLLDDSRSRARNIFDLFTPALQAQRRKFCDYCDRLLFSEPHLYGRKGEELLWRKGFYEVISTAKKLKKKDFSIQEVNCIQGHIYAGIGFYHHMILKLNLKLNIRLQNIVDCEIVLTENINEFEITPELKEWGLQAIHQCLIYLGDLSRYKLELKPNSDSAFAIRYYLQAAAFKPDFGMPHNQMGTLSMNKNNFLDAVYHYLRCLACKIPFEGTLNNLQSLFEKNSKFIEQLPQVDENADCIIEPEKSENIKRFIARFLLLIDIWYFNKKVPNVYSLCHQTYKNLEECLVYSKPTASESGESPIGDMESVDSEPVYLSDQMVFRVIVICLLTISKLQASNAPPLSTLIAFTLSIYSQIIQKLSSHIEEAVLNYPLSEENKKSYGILKELMNVGNKKSRSKIRRRKPFKDDSEEDSDLSENGEEYDYSSSDDSFISDTEDVLVESSDEDIDIIKVENVSITETTKQINGVKPKNSNQSEDSGDSKEFILTKVQKMDAGVMLEIINEEGLLQSVRMVNDWLRSDQEIVKSCASNARVLIRQMVHLINLINIDLGNLKTMDVKFKISEIINNENKIPLAEDISLKGIKIFENTQNRYDWDYLLKRDINSKEEAVIRIIKILSFGKLLTKIEESGITFDDNPNSLVVCKLDDKPEEVSSELSTVALMEELERQETVTTLSKTSLTNGEARLESGGQISNSKMKHMGQLWLAAEVRALESRVGGTKASLSPYLVLDADALIKYTHMVKHLVHSRQFILLVPAAVVSALDDLKKEHIEARDAIRWLESQFHKGNRFFRAQRPSERTPIPFMKYPKKKDKEMHIFIQIIECCNYFGDQQKGASNVVTFLIGSNQQAFSNGENNKDFSYAGLAKSIGIVLEPITSFYGKWKKSKGNR
ncbi:nonsense-mediated mRNA decay factor SMG5 [Euwallacea similis]|uniref:nonsense-mediated mRNA decay factor SMG5 n=1 Tax=Euwallacea similis TaxID=1736056 RepID=UPI00344EFEB2